MNIFRLVLSNIRKRKSASLTFFVMVTISALMLSVSLSLLVGGSDFYEKKVNELNAPHYTTSIIKDSYKPEFDTFVQNYQGTSNISKISSLFVVGTWQIGSNKTATSTFFYNQKEFDAESFYTLPIIDSLTAKPENMVIVPISFKSQGAKAGDKIRFLANGCDYEFTVYGFREDAIYGSSTAGGTIVYIDDESYTDFTSDNTFTSFINLMVRFEKMETHRAFKTDFRKFAKLNGNEEFYVTFDGSQDGATTFINMIAVLLIMFSLIILLVAIIIVIFNINNSISEDIATIGALKGLGYKNKVLKRSRLTEFVFIAALGSILGALISLFAFGFLGNIVASTSGLLWLNKANFIPIIMSILVICTLIAVITCICVRKYKKITPINALRQGTSNHSFKKNPAPLEKYKMPINLHLGIKRFFVSLKNNITLTVIVSLLVFISVLVNCLSYNLNNDRTAMTQMVGLEMSDAYVQVNPGSDIYEIHEEIKMDSDVKQTILYGSKDCTIDGVETVVDAVSDYSLLTINTLITGRHPELYNEITLGAAISKAIGKGFGDTVAVEVEGKLVSYIVVGITQNIANGGENCGITYEAILRQCSGFRMDTIYVYLIDGISAKDYIDSLADNYGNRILTANPDEQMDTILSSMGDPFLAVSIIMIAVTIVVIGFVLFLIISAMIRKHKKEFGIMKAIGFKNRQIMRQILISFLPSLIVGAMLGIILSFAIINPLSSIFFASMGLLKVYFIIPTVGSIAIGVGILAVSILMSYVISLRMRKISPQRLIIEQ